MSRQKLNSASPSSTKRSGNFAGSGSKPTQSRVSASRQRAVVERILPFSVEALASSAKDGGKAAEPIDWIFDPDAKTILTDLIPRTVRLRAFQAFLDAAVSEQVARMTAMKAATDNANDMIKSLGRQFNRSRQSQITTELTEIMGGAAALE